MLKPSDFNDAVPQFQNGNYASNPINPQYVEEPSSTDYNRGAEPLQTLPAQWWNWFINKFTSRFNKVNIYVKNLFNELAQLLSLVNVTPDGTEGAVTDGQLKNAFKELYPDYINTKLALGSTYVKQTQKVNGHALSGDVTVTKGDVGLGNVVNTGDSATPTENGTTKFTTGGAYTELNKKVDKSSVTSSVAKDNNNPVTSGGAYNYRYTPKGYKDLGTEGWYKIAEFGKRNRGQSIVIDLCRGYSVNPNEAHHIIVSYGWTDVNVFDFAKSANKLFDEIKLCWNSNNNDKLAIYVHYTGSAENSCYFSISGMVVDSQYVYTTNLEIFNFTTDSLVWENSKTIPLGENGFYINGENRTPDAPTTDGDYLLKSAVSGSTPSFSWQRLSDTVKNNDMNPVTSNAVSKALAVPSDATLHYSFDDVPDYPDGTAVYFRNKNFASVEDWGVNTSSESISVSNGSLKIQSLGLRAYMGVLNNTVLSTSNLNTNIIKIKFYCSNFRSVYLQDNGGSYEAHTIFTVNSLGNNWYEAIGVCESYSIAQTLIFSLSSASSDNYAIIEAIYIGDGSYSTPIIDNSGDNINAVNNGCVAVQGVCGKGLKLLQGSTATIGKFDFGNDLTVSVWVNPDNDTEGLVGNILNKTNCINIRNGGSSNNYFYYGFWNSSTSAWQYISTTSLLLKNTWTHIVITKNGTEVKLYINGVWSKVSAVANDIAVNDYNLTLGSTVNTRSQAIDDLLIFNRALSEDEVTALYMNKANTPKFYNLNNYLLDNRSAVPAENGTNLFTTGGAYTLQQSVNGKAPTDHASFTGEYGQATTTMFGHAKLNMPIYATYLYNTFEVSLQNYDLGFIHIYNNDTTGNLRVRWGSGRKVSWLLVNEGSATAGHTTLTLDDTILTSVPQGAHIFLFIERTGGINVAGVAM